MHHAISITAATLAAVAYAYAAVAQQRAARHAPPKDSMSLRLLLDLMGSRSWLAGTGLIVLAFALQAVGLGFGSVALVEPIVVTELVFALPLAMRVAHRRAGRREWLGVVAVVGGVVAFLLASGPRGGTADPGLLTWATTAGPCVLGVAGFVALASGPPGPRRATLLACAAGISFGLLALVTKSFDFVLARGVAAALTSWQPYALVVIGVVSFVFAQSAYQAAPLATSLPVIDALEPTVAVVLSTYAFGGHIGHTPLDLAFESVGALATITGVFALGRSPVVLAIYEQQASEGRAAAGAGSQASNATATTGEASRCRLAEP